MPFQKGHKLSDGKGRPKGAKNKKTEQWEALHTSIITEHSTSFNRIMRGYARKKDKTAFMENYIKILKHFKPTLQSQQFDTGNEDFEFNLTIRKQSSKEE